MKKFIAPALVLVFIVVLLFAACDARGEGLKITLGHTVFNSEVTNAELSYEWGDYSASVGQFGHGWTKVGDKGVTEYYSFSRLVRPDWSFAGAKNYYRIGAAYVPDSELVGDTNFRLGTGLDWGIFAIEYAHFSSAGLHDPNSGEDAIQARFNTRFDAKF